MANDDKKLDDYLTGNSKLSKDYHASNSAEPSAVLDDKILTAARDAVDSDRQTKIIRRPRWTVPISIAAIITLSVSLVVTMQQETGQPLISEPVSDSYVLPESKDLRVKQDLDAEATSLQRERMEDIPMERREQVDMMDAYRTDNDAKELKNEARQIQPAKKILMKEKAASLVTEEELLMEQVVPAAPARMDAMSEADGIRQSDEQKKILFEIKSLWEQGRKEEAKIMYMQFLQSNNDYSHDELQNILGEELLLELQSE